MALSVKAYFYKPDGNTEIRRFSVDQDVTTSFEYLSHKVRDVFPGLQDKRLTFYWAGKKLTLYFRFLHLGLLVHLI